MVKRQRGKSRSHIRAALHNGQLIGGKGKQVASKSASQRRNAGAWLRGFYHGAVAGGKGADQRADAEKKRIIPRRTTPTTPQAAATVYLSYVKIIILMMLILK